MILYHHLIEGRFVSRINRFVAVCEIGGAQTVVHVKNTGRLRELLLPGAKVWLEASDNPARKTCYDLVCVEASGYVVNIDSQAPNAVFREWASCGGYLPRLTALRPETVYGASRFDFSYMRHGRPGYAEIKGVTLFDGDGVACFPDAPTERGVKHIRELIHAVREGHEAGICFVLQRDFATGLRPNDATHPAFGEALREAASAGVRLTAVVCHVTPDACTADHEVPVILSRKELSL